MSRHYSKFRKSDASKSHANIHRERSNSIRKAEDRDISQDHNDLNKISDSVHEKTDLRDIDPDQRLKSQSSSSKKVEFAENSNSKISKQSIGIKRRKRNKS